MGLRTDSSTQGSSSSAASCPGWPSWRSSGACESSPGLDQPGTDFDLPATWAYANPGDEELPFADGWKPVGMLAGSGKHADIQGIDWFVLKDGKIHRLYQQIDLMKLIDQIGLAD